MACRNCSCGAGAPALGADKKPCPKCASGGFGFKSPPPLIVPPRADEIPGRRANPSVRRILRGGGFFGT